MATLKLLEGYFFGRQDDNEEIKYLKVDNSTNLIYKGELKLGDEEASLKGKEVEVKLDGKTYKAIIQ